MGFVRPEPLHRVRAALGALTLTLTAACSLNAATGRLQLTTISESEEIELGKETDAEVVEALGLYEDEALEEMVERVGAELAEQSERPGLPWTFRVLDEPAVNAFALPGGYVYATRGLLVHLDSEDELAAVLGHEIGHVTARHGVVQLRKTRVAAASVGVFRVIDPGLRHVGGIAASTAGLALLKYSRDDEYEADSLGLRYAGRAGFDRAATVAVFDVLIGVGRVEQGDTRVPTWLSTHPDPQLRRDRVRSMIPGEGTVPAPDPEYLAKLDGVLYGLDPRDGYLLDGVFVHPRQGFALDLPPEWEAMSEGPRVMATSPDEEAILVLTPSDAESAQAALDAFFADGTIAKGEAWEGEVGGFHVVSAGFSLSTPSASIYGLLAFIDYDEQVLGLAALGPAEGWEQRSGLVAASFASFRRAEPELARVDPMRVRTYALPQSMSLAELQQQRPSSIELSRLCLLNGVDEDETLEEGRVVKRVEGFNPAAAAPSTTPAPDTAR